MAGGHSSRALTEETRRRAGQVTRFVSDLHRKAFIEGIAKQRRLRGRPDDEESIYHARRRAARGVARRMTALVAQAIGAGLGAMTASLTLLWSMAPRNALLPVRALVRLRQKIHARWVRRLGAAGLPYAFIHWAAEPGPDGQPHFHVTAIVPPGREAEAFELLRRSVFRQHPRRPPQLASETVLRPSKPIGSSDIKRRRRGDMVITWVDYVHKSAVWDASKLLSKGKADLLSHLAWAWANRVTPAATRLSFRRAKARITEVAASIALPSPPEASDPAELGVRTSPPDAAPDAPSGDCYPAGASVPGETGRHSGTPAPRESRDGVFLRRYAEALEAEAVSRPPARARRSIPGPPGEDVVALRQRVAVLERVLRRSGVGEPRLAVIRRRAGLGRT